MWNLFYSLRKQPAFRDATTHSVFFPQNAVQDTSEEILYWWRVTTQIWEVLLIGCSEFPSRDNQSEGLFRSEKWRVISMEFLHSFLRRHIPGKPVVATWNLQKEMKSDIAQFSAHELNLSCNKSGCYRLRKIITEICNKICTCCALYRHKKVKSSPNWFVAAQI